MINFCAVRGCSNKLCLTKGNSEISYHKFPNHPGFLDQWIRFCGRHDGWKPRPHQGICSKHFDPSCFGEQNKMRRKLKSGVIPSIKPGTAVDDITRNRNAAAKAKTEDITRSPKSETEMEQIVKSEDGFSHMETESRVDDHNYAHPCRICQSELSTDAKNLLEQAVENKSYMSIIEEMLKIQIFYDYDKHMLICNKCSSFIEDIHSFAQLCRASLTEIIKFPNGSSYTVHQEQLEEEKETILEIQIEPIDTHAIKSEDTDQAKNEAPKQCDICGVFIKQDLKLHKKTHSNVSVKCEVCGKTYTNARQLQVHMNVHTKNIPYPCKFCDKVFYVWRSQKDHEQTHLDKVNNVEHRCAECGNIYSTKKQLEVHFKLKHLGIRKHACQQCSFKTNQKDRLLHHVRATHTDKRPYGCPVCDNTTSNDSNHYIHFQRHKKKGESNEYQIKCAYCGKVFTKDAVFELHLIDDHPEEAVIV